MARAMRGEIPMRGSNPNQPYYMTPEPQKGVRINRFHLLTLRPNTDDAEQSELKDKDGLKLTLEANLDVEIELKASIRGDLTLSL